MYATENGNINIVELLLKRGADIDIKASDGRTALAIASKNGHKNIEELLKDAGAKL
jgi:ankyrin repeat protein